MSISLSHTHTRQKCNFHLPSSVLSLYQKGAYSIGVEVVNSLPQSIQNLSDDLTISISPTGLFT
jgi:hypothetical protein